jgi:hypothetical protein
VGNCFLYNPPGTAKHKQLEEKWMLWVESQDEVRSCLYVFHDAYLWHILRMRFVAYPGVSPKSSSIQLVMPAVVLNALLKNQVKATKRAHG